MIELDEKVNFCFNSEIKNVQPKLFRYIFSLCPHKEDAEDILQKTNLILIQKQETFDSKRASFPTWCCNIAKYQVMAFLTIKRRSKLVFSNELVDVIADDLNQSKDLKIKMKALNACYDKLPPHMATIAHLRYKKNFSLKQISKTVSRPLGAISATMYRIRSNIKNCIDAEYNKALIDSEN